jgi:hypothetical protein
MRGYDISKPGTHPDSKTNMAAKDQNPPPIAWLPKIGGSTRAAITRQRERSIADESAPTAIFATW